MLFHIVLKLFIKSFLGLIISSGLSPARRPIVSYFVHILIVLLAFSVARFKALAEDAENISARCGG
jgi:hypothetical protein